jgi:hypothetical protein
MACIAGLESQGMLAVLFQIRANRVNKRRRERSAIAQPRRFTRLAGVDGDGGIYDYDNTRNKEAPG